MSQAFVKTSQHLDVFQENQGQWDVRQFIVTVATDLNDDTPTSFDLIPTLEKKRLNYQTKKKWLPSMFNYNTPEYRGKVIGPMFVSPRRQYQCLDQQSAKSGFRQQQLVGGYDVDPGK